MSDRGAMPSGCRTMYAKIYVRGTKIHCEQKIRYG
jgi:hypothetical protein